MEEEDTCNRMNELYTVVDKKFSSHTLQSISLLNYRDVQSRKSQFQTNNDLHSEEADDEDEENTSSTANQSTPSPTSTDTAINKVTKVTRNLFSYLKRI